MQEPQEDLVVEEVDRMRLQHQAMQETLLQQVLLKEVQVEMDKAQEQGVEVAELPLQVVMLQVQDQMVMVVTEVQEHQMKLLVQMFHMLEVVVVETILHQVQVEQVEQEVVEMVQIHHQIMLELGVLTLVVAVVAEVLITLKVQLVDLV
jgi:hypothetical protein